MIKNRFVAPLLFAILLAPLVARGQEPRPAAQPPANYGRFVIVFSPYARADTFLLDTQTGKTWQLAKYTDVLGEPLVWQYLSKFDNEADLLQWMIQQKTKAEK